MLNLETALNIAMGTLEAGRERDFAPLCAAVLDPGGHLIALLRDDGASISRPEIAIGKAAGCLGMGFGGRELARRAQAMPQFFTSLASIFPKGIVPVPGGILLRNDDGAIVGAVGVSGDTSDNDEIAALAGIAPTGFTADTGD
jgi:uncharacterized protein GlcG (DUF336 family)